MYRLSWRQALWALALLCVLAPSNADGNIGCLFSSSLCIKGVEWCYDDFAFGRCISIFEEEAEEGDLYRYDMNSEQLKWFESELQRLAERGYRWEHAYTQCVLQAMLYTLRQDLDPAKVNAKICDHFADPKLSNIPLDDENENTEAEPDETAYIRFTPNSPQTDSDFANEVYSPPDDPMSTYLVPGGNAVPVIVEEDAVPDDETPSDKVRNLLMHADEELPVNLPFEGFRERIQAEKVKAGDNDNTIPDAVLDKEKKSLPDVELLTQGSPNSDYLDEERVGAHYRKIKTRPPPYTAEYITSNRLSDLDAEVRFNALEKYKQSFAEKNFPFEYENPGELPEPRIYIDEDGLDDFPVDSGSGERDPYHIMKDKNKMDLKHSKNMEYLMNYWREIIDSKLKPQGALYAEGGPMKADDLQSHGNTKAQKLINGGHDHNEYDYDPSYAYVLFKNRVDPGEVTFKVEKNSKNYDAVDVASRVDEIKDDLRLVTGAQVIQTGVGDRVNSKRPVIRHSDSTEGLIWGLDMPVVLALVGSLSVLIVGAVVFAILLKRDLNARRKMQGLSTATEIDAEATRDYQELCRARMSGKWTGQQTAAAPHSSDAPQRITSLSREPDGNSPSTRSSTSSWSEEPTLTNMDISTGHMVLAYMEDHLRNKDRLEQEWRALCAYEAEPCATVAALKPENTGKNRYPEVLPYDHSRVTLNTLSNHLGSDYINASTITDHDPRNPAYIAAAGPLAHTAPDFWQMVWEQGSVVMVMLTRLTENGNQLCHRYWPEEGSELYHIYEVHLVSEHIWCDDYLVRSFYLKNQCTGETRTVTQFHFLSWPENGVPSSTKALLEFRRKVNKSYRGRSCPIVVHCSDGAGRTGTYCLIDMVLNRMAKGAKEIDIAATLEHIRDQRVRTVATKQQFEFVLMAVAEEVHAILKALPAHLQQMQEKKDKEKEKDKDKDTEKEKPN
ncbi:receptor-type tyrosine-protein phosphatase N2 isoform X9 [Hyposmocoma kahamanoa]|uniref:receptor-type tyrosine-protein phosphatase N2 isoform X9 n=1 Tax=Hyposmocoma kahamanoa TaxID=1477025 RepID=UPI000E6D6AB5|nr:receptor-type tyrosine-protein phosphatase N2 isoform X9 [Hyposmocoma kahamanoa]